MKYQAIIFDMDGTITDSEQLWDKATDAFLYNLGILLTLDEKRVLYNGLQGISLRDSVRYLKDTFSLSPSAEQLTSEFAQYASSLMGTEVRFIDDFLHFHGSLDSHSLKYAIATNADRLTLAAQTKALSLDSLFGEHIYNIDHVTNGKPKPDIYLHAANKLNISPYACIAIEDSACGIEAAKSANMFCIGINSHNNLQQLTRADMIINSYKEIDLAKLLY